MKFGERFSEYLHGDDERFLDKCTHVEYKRLKKLLKKCRLGLMQDNIVTESCSERPYNSQAVENQDIPSVKITETFNVENNVSAIIGFKVTEAIFGDNIQALSFGKLEDKLGLKLTNQPLTWGNMYLILLQSKGQICDKFFFYELTKEVSAIVGCFSSRARRLLHLHLASGFQRYLWRLRHCFADDHQAMIQEGRNLVSYVAMNAIAIRKILKKYDKVHCSVTGRNFKAKLQADHIELLKSPWLVELSAFQINTRDSEHGDIGEIFPQCSCEFTGSEPVITCTLPDSVKLEFNLRCPICLDTVFDPVALGCGHIFCNSCACAGASVPMIEGIKAANRRAKCPICRQVFFALSTDLFEKKEISVLQMGVYADSVHLTELGLLVKRRCRGYWKERLHTERAERVKQAKEHWDLQSRFILGF
eukprot:Gb_25731 [translate_table: standard]